MTSNDVDRIVNQCGKLVSQRNNTRHGTTLIRRELFYGDGAKKITVMGQELFYDDRAIKKYGDEANFLDDGARNVLR